MIRVNHQTISENAILHEMQYHPAADHRAAMVEAAQSLIIGELLLQRAIQLGLTIANNDDLSQEAKTDALLDALVAADVEVPNANEVECQQYYQQNPLKFSTSPLLAARHILLAAAPEDDEARVQAKTQAEQLIASLQQGADFSELAKQFSRCDSAQLGGQLGQISKGQTVPEFERQVFSAEQGLMAHPVESRYGFHVVSIDFKEPGKLLPFDLVQQRIASYLNEKVQRKAIAQYIQMLIGEAQIDGFDINVSSSPLLQ